MKFYFRNQFSNVKLFGVLKKLERNSGTFFGKKTYFVCSNVFSKAKICCPEKEFLVTRSDNDGCGDGDGDSDGDGNDGDGGDGDDDARGSVQNDWAG